VNEFAAEAKVQYSLHPAASQALADNLWPGNVRELRHCIERACILAPTPPVLTSADIFGQTPSVDEKEEVPAGSLTTHLRTTERRFIEQALADHQGRIKETAAALGISRKNLWEKMRKLELSAPEENS
jgi:transcriptional regulator with PAS, ATPase and Fis domain